MCFFLFFFLFLFCIERVKYVSNPFLSIIPGLPNKPWKSGSRGRGREERLGRKRGERERGREGEGGELGREEEGGGEGSGEGRGWEGAV